MDKQYIALHGGHTGWIDILDDADLYYINVLYDRKIPVTYQYFDENGTVKIASGLIEEIL